MQVTKTIIHGIFTNRLNVQCVEDSALVRTIAEAFKDREFEDEDDIASAIKAMVEKFSMDPNAGFDKIEIKFPSLGKEIRVELTQEDIAIILQNTVSAVNAFFYGGDTPVVGMSILRSILVRKGLM